MHMRSKTFRVSTTKGIWTTSSMVTAYGIPPPFRWTGDVSPDGTVRPAD